MLRLRGSGLYCDACEVGLSLLLSWLEGALLFQGELEPSAGELLKLSSSSMPLAASNCVFSSRVIRRSSSSPNSPPISVGSPTTITSCRDTIISIILGKVNGHNSCLTDWMLGHENNISVPIKRWFVTHFGYNSFIKIST